MMEQANACECHCHIVLVACTDNMIISYRTSRLCDIAYTAFVCTFDIVSEGEECVRAQSYASHCIQPCTFLFAGQYFRLLCKKLLPDAVCEYVIMIF